MPENETINLLLSLSRTCALQCLAALWAIGPLPVTTIAVVDAVGESEESVKRGLRRLRTRGLVVCDNISGRETNWRLAPPAVQLPLPLDLLDLAHSPLQVEPAPLPRGIATGLQTEQPNAAVDNNIFAQAPLQVEDPAQSTTPVFAESATSGKPESARAGIIISYKNQGSVESTNNNKTRPGATPLFAESPDSSAPKKPRHIADVIRALRKRGQPAVADDPFPPDLRHCVERLTAIHCTRKRAELAVARSPFDAPTILAEIAKWKARKASPEGRSITHSGFPFLVAARIENGDHCPGGEYDVEPEPAPAEPIQPEMSADVPAEPPPHYAVHLETPLPGIQPQPLAERWQNIWNATLGQLMLEMPRPTFDTWFAGAELLAFDEAGQIFTIGLRDQYSRDWVANRMAGVIKRIVTSLAGLPAEVRFAVTSHA